MRDNESQRLNKSGARLTPSGPAAELLVLDPATAAARCAREATTCSFRTIGRDSLAESTAGWPGCDKRHGTGGWFPRTGANALGSLIVKAIRRFTVRTVLPEPLAPLRDLMLNLRWSWHPETVDLFASIDPAAWDASGGDPITMLSALRPERLAALAADQGFLARLDAAAQILGGYLTGPRWFQRDRRERAAGHGAVRDRLLLTRVRHHRGPAGVLRWPRHPGRRPPQGRERPGCAADRRRAAVPARLLHPVAVRGRLAG